MTLSGSRAGALLLFLGLLVHTPAVLRGGFVMDDDVNVFESVHMRSKTGLQDLWLKIGPRRGGTVQYYPVTYSTFWLQYRFWESGPAGYHFVNALLHAVNALLAWRVLLQLGVPGAWFAAALFAVHPVQSETVAWISELKNLLSAFFSLLAFGAVLRALEQEDDETLRRLPDERPVLYGKALLFFLLALGSKTTACTLPAALLLTRWWKNGRLSRTDLRVAAPMLLVAVAAGLVTASVETAQAGASGPEWALGARERLAVAGRAVWFYAGKLLWPTDLAFIYPRWDPSALSLFPAAAALALVGALWAARGRLGRGPLAAALFYGGTLLPALGFINLYFMRYSFVADHFQYMACLGPMAAFAAGAERALSRFGGRGSLVAAACLLAALGRASWARDGIYASEALLWADTLRKNPNCWLAVNNLGVVAAQEGRAAKAEALWRRALELKPDYAEAHVNLGMALDGLKRFEEAEAHLRAALAQEPVPAQAHNNLGALLARQGRFEEALRHFEQAARLMPSVAAAKVNAGLVLLQLGRKEQARRNFEDALLLAPEDTTAQKGLRAAQ